METDQFSTTNTFSMKSFSGRLEKPNKLYLWYLNRNESFSYNWYLVYENFPGRLEKLDKPCLLYLNGNISILPEEDQREHVVKGQDSDYMHHMRRIGKIL